MQAAHSYQPVGTWRARRCGWFRPPVSVSSHPGAESSMNPEGGGGILQITF